MCNGATREMIGRFSSILRLKCEIDLGFANSRSPRRALALGPRRGAAGKKGLKMQKNFVAPCLFVQMMFRLDHAFLQFPEGPASSVEYSSRRDALIGRRVLEATVIDRDILRDAGL
ncbi:hypothetical protein L2E82_30737 [Cichorium intybus]|uniref:Uncharacterized protein n=1 Tax=Cichorium intybus TaxID=13427 RepID=A0ACB9D169_CICIN|nr:hypothetical protein L2E82_30737 [Cichorium intybus]